MRWKVEGFFSNFKRIFGEGVQATSREGMFREIRMKVNGYNIGVTHFARNGAQILLIRTIC